MTNKEKAHSILARIYIKQEALRNALHWQYSDNEVKAITVKIQELQDKLVAMIPD